MLANRSLKAELERGNEPAPSQKVECPPAFSLFASFTLNTSKAVEYNHGFCILPFQILKNRMLLLVIVSR